MPNEVFFLFQMVVLAVDFQITFVSNPCVCVCVCVCVLTLMTYNSISGQQNDSNHYLCGPVKMKIYKSGAVK